MGPLVRIGVGQKSLRFLGGRQPAGDVDRRAADERRIVAHRRRRNAQRLKLLEHGLVDEILRRRHSIDRRTQRQRGAKHRHLPLIAGHDRHRAGQIAGGHQTGRADFGHLRVVRLEFRHQRDIFDRSVGIMRQANQLLLGGGTERSNRRDHFDARHHRIVRLAVGHPLRDPSPQEFVRHRIDFHPLTAAMRNQTGGLLQQQTAIRRGGR